MSERHEEKVESRKRESDGGKRTHGQEVELVIWEKPSQEDLHLFSSFSAIPLPASPSQTKCTDK